MFAKKEPKNPIVTYPKQGLAENRYTADGKIWAASNLVSWVKEKNYPVFKLPLAGVNLDHLPWEINNLDDIIWHSKRIQDTNRSQFLEDYAANLAAQATEIILGNNIVRK